MLLVKVLATSLTVFIIVIMEPICIWDSMEQSVIMINEQDGDVNGSMRWTPWRGNWYRFCRLHVAHSKASMMMVKAARQGYTLRGRLVGLPKIFEKSSFYI